VFGVEVDNMEQTDGENDEHVRRIFSLRGEREIELLLLYYYELNRGTLVNQAHAIGLERRKKRR
jgi:hypothetical protein